MYVVKTAHARNEALLTQTIQTQAVFVPCWKTAAYTGLSGH